MDCIARVDRTGATAGTPGSVSTAAAVAATAASAECPGKLAATVATSYFGSSKPSPKPGWTLRWGRTLVGKDRHA